MLIVMHRNATQKQIGAVIKAVEKMGLTASSIPGGERTAIGVLGNKEYVDDLSIRDLPGVKEVIHVSKPYKMVSRDFHPRPTIIKIDHVEIGEGKVLSPSPDHAPWKVDRKSVVEGKSVDIGGGRLI